MSDVWGEVDVVNMYFNISAEQWCAVCYNVYCMHEVRAYESTPERALAELKSKLLDIASRQDRSEQA